LILVVGAGGQLGTAFRSLLADQAVYLTHQEFDLVDLGAIHRVVTSIEPELILNCAAFNAVDRAEEEEGLAYRINALAVGELAAAATELGCRLVTFSSDYVFDGRVSRPYLEDDTPNPLNAYGRSKRAGEELALAIGPASLVVRTSWVLSATHPNFLASVLQKVRRGESVRVVADQFGSPTVAEDLAMATWQAIRGGTIGLLHLANRGATSRFGLAQAAVRMSGLDPSRVHPCTTAEYTAKAVRPASSILGSSRLEVQGIQPLPHWEDSVPKVVAGLLEWL
jgi:dTDP-4-dehydrorhamnose reductase